MKRVLYTLLLSFLIFNNTNIFADTTTFYVIEIKQEINAASAKKLSKGFREAKSINANYIIIHLNTYGGAVNAADSMRTLILNSSTPTIAFIDNQAASAGALISIACDSIYMRRGSSIGAATVVNQTGEPMPDKYQSFMRAMMRSTAEVTGRDPQIAEAMVDPYIHIPGIIDSGKVLSFTPEEAILHNYCEGVVESLDQIATIVSGENSYNIIHQKLSFAELVLLFFLNPIVQGILLMLIIGGIYFELQSPGIGFPSAAAIIAAILYFSPLYIEGIANNWEIIVFVIGVLLILAEIFVIPGFGIAGISGIILMITGLSFAMVENDLFYNQGDYNFSIVVAPIAKVLLSSFLSLSLSIYLASKLFKSNRLPNISLKTTLKGDNAFSLNRDDSDQSYVGKIAIVKTAMRPSGKIEIEEQRLEATLESGFADTGDTVLITKVEGGRLYCVRHSE